MPLNEGVGGAEEGAAHVGGVGRLGRRRQRGSLHLKQAAQAVHPCIQKVSKGGIQAGRVRGGEEQRVAPEREGEAPRPRRKRLRSHVSGHGQRGEGGAEAKEGRGKRGKGARHGLVKGPEEEPSGGQATKKLTCNGNPISVCVCVLQGLGTLMCWGRTR